MTTTSYQNSKKAPESKKTNSKVSIGMLKLLFAYEENINVSRLAKKMDMTYSHTYLLITTLTARKILKTKKIGRDVRIYGLSEKHQYALSEMQQLFKKIER